MITFACLHLTRFNHEMNVSEGSKYHGTKSRMATWWLLLLFRAMELTNSNHMTAHIWVGGGQTAPFSGGACENAQMHQEEFIVFHSQARNVPKCLKCTQSKVKARISVGCVGIIRTLEMVSEPSDDFFQNESGGVGLNGAT